MRGETISGALIIKGVNQLLNPPIINGISIKKLYKGFPFKMSPSKQFFVFCNEITAIRRFRIFL